MAAPKRTDFQHARDRREIADLYVRGWSQSRIADELNRRRSEEWDKAAGETDAPPPYELTRQMIGYDLKAIQAEWRKLSAFDLDDLKAQQLAKLDETERAAWAGYERSCGVVEDKQMRRTTFVRAAEIIEPNYPGGNPRTIPGKTETRTVEQRKRSELVGDPRFLQVVNNCIKQRCEILGLNAPAEVKHSGTLTLAELVKSTMTEAAGKQNEKA